MAETCWGCFMAMVKPEQDWRRWGHAISEPRHSECDPGSMSCYLVGALGKLEMLRHGERVMGKAGPCPGQGPGGAGAGGQH